LIMNKLRYVGVDETLTTEQGQLIRSAAVEAARRQLIGRKLFGSSIFGPLGEGVVTYGYDTKTRGAGARTDWGWPGVESQEALNFARSTVSIPLHHQEFEINKLDLAASRLNGTPLNMSKVEAASYDVALQEDTVLIEGWSRDGSTYEINGLYQGAGNDENTALDYGTKANIETSINNAIALLLADNIPPPYNLTLNPVQYSQTLALIANTSQSYLNWIRSVIQGEVYVTPAITAGTGLMSKTNPQGMFELVLAEDLTVETEVLEKSKNLWGKVYIRGLPVIYDSNALCKLSAI